ncbi:hypothetical protein NC652_032701 [Populus alba x Populus x berolinensis]|uniref:Uncharacterized protein n=1 Tax=Populus alba x Populus x berolinensis TaxID=444605 RepID=A0AAD6LS55_9ROSI|nr:hypothetical protein NC652_032701 [Populus alba x Populus x berolinensis]KAJ6972136.1 hypothetical protein NC653_032650 [Populus alba x Populus x berolinensis]
MFLNFLQTHDLPFQHQINPSLQLTASNSSPPATQKALILQLTANNSSPLHHGQQRQPPCTTIAEPTPLSTKPNPAIILAEIGVHVRKS